MANPNWDDGMKVTIPAKGNGGYWTLVLEYLDGSGKLMFVVPDDEDEHPQRWTLGEGMLCTADGDPKAPINPANCILANATPGALIAKIGGSTAGKNDGAKVFVVGRFCVLDLDETIKGPLYLTMNSDVMSESERGGEIRVMVYRSLSAASAPP